MDIFNNIKSPTLLIDPARAQTNIRRMLQKAKAQKIRFRPHFKTHQSASIGSWFRNEGVSAITVSSVDMARYFAQNGWDDITIAFPINWRQIQEIQELANQIHLGILVESVESVRFLQHHFSASVDVWLKVDVGAHRTGLAWDEPQGFIEIATRIQTMPNLHLAGLLTHAGQTYHAPTQDAIRSTYTQSVDNLNQLCLNLASRGLDGLQISVGDTPGCSLCSDLGTVDEIRPGNFIFFDAQQLSLGCCTPQEVAVALACPVVAKHTNRREVVIYGGAIHLSKDFVEENDHITYGYVARPEGSGWSDPIPGAYVAALSQEHGIIRFDKDGLDASNIGDLLIIIPAHSCLAVTHMKTYLTLSGEYISTMNTA